MLQGIVTKFLGPTNSRGSRIKATSASGISVTIPTDYELTDEENHKKAAVALIKKLGWESQLKTGMSCGGLPGGDVAHVFHQK